MEEEVKSEVIQDVQKQAQGKPKNLDLYALFERQSPHAFSPATYVI